MYRLRLLEILMEPRRERSRQQVMVRSHLFGRLRRKMDEQDDVMSKLEGALRDHANPLIHEKLAELRTKMLDRRNLLKAAEFIALTEPMSGATSTVTDSSSKQTSTRGQIVLEERPLREGEPDVD